MRMTIPNKNKFMVNRIIKKEKRKIQVSPEIIQKMIVCARDFRKSSTKSEETLWQVLRNRQWNNLKFRRQHPIGPFVVDFFCAELNLIVEIDGLIHKQQEKRDAERQSLIESCGYQFFRISAKQVEDNLSGVLLYLKKIIDS